MTTKHCRGNLCNAFGFHKTFFQLSFATPYFFRVDFDAYEKSFLEDTDGEGRVLFSKLDVKAAYDEGELVGKGIGTRCMNSLKHFLYEKGVERFDTDTALNNQVAQHYYEKNSFIREGVTRSYYEKH